MHIKKNTHTQVFQQTKCIPKGDGWHKKPPSRQLPASTTSASMCKDRKVKDNNKFTIHKGYMIQRICKTYNIRKYSNAIQTVITISTEPNTTPPQKRMSIPFLCNCVKEYKGEISCL